MRSSSDPLPSRGRPRSPEVHQAILDAALAIVAEVGPTALTIEAVAARAAVGKATIYRRWPSKLPLIMEAIDQLPPLSAPDTGEVGEDLRRLLREFLRIARSTPLLAVLMGMAAEADRDEELARQLAGYNSRRREPIAAVLRHGVERGELPATLDVDLAVDLLMGTLLARLNFRSGPVDASLADRVVAAALGGIGQ